MDNRAETAAVLGSDLVGSVLVLTLNRPAARNALSPQLVAALDAALTRLERDDAILATVLTGSGSAFCACLDLKAYASSTADRSAVRNLLHGFGSLAKPVIGAVNGAAVAGGLELALCCDFLVGGPGAAFADTHVRIGAFPGGGMTARLGRAVGIRTARAMSLAGLRLDVDGAARAGLLSEVTSEERLLERAIELAAAIAAAKPDLVAEVRRLYDENQNRSLPDAMAAETAALLRWRETRTDLDWSV